ncbi:MAG: sodium-dependent transporter [Spirochaetales bacterium]|nr:sodium-dependent transporter [Spirochaetales bacterium]
MSDNQKASKSRNTFSDKWGFILASAGSAVGLGNIWRFPYLAAKNGGGLFLFVYIIFALTFGFSLLITEIAIGRKTKQSCLTAYKQVSAGWGVLGWLAFIVPSIIYTYYCVIGGWVLKYLIAFFNFSSQDTAADGYFTAFITNPLLTIIFCAIFSFISAFIIYHGVEKGLEKYSRILMPILVILVIAVSVYSCFIKYNDAVSHVTRTGWDGLKVYLIPDFKGLTLGKFFTVCLDAIGQLFYSLSIAMGIMVTYGSYMKDDVDLNRSVNHIEIFDTGIALLAGMMIIPAVYVFKGLEGMSAGPGLMFVSLPNVFMSMGLVGHIVGLLFFIMVAFAAMTSCMSILEAIVSGMIDKFGWSREKSVVIAGTVSFVISIIICLGYKQLYFELPLPNGTTAQLLDIFDYVSNNIIMPILAILTCVLIGWIVKPDYIISEIRRNGAPFHRKWIYIIMVKYIAPVFLVLLLLFSVGIIRV